MGKKGGGKKGGGAAASAAPRCTCDHPYQCNCGNRPERPSKGHKWYPEEQIWAGKGHKQKGASGQTASLSKEAVVTQRGQTKIEQWQKLPSQLLADVCKKEKRPPPKYKALDKQGGGPSKHKYRCIVQDAKQSRRGGEHDLILIPRAAVDNEEQAREESALLALLQLTPKIPHERKLPEPYKTTWTNAVQALSEGGGSGRGSGSKSGVDKKAGGGGKKEEGSNTATNSNKSNASTNDRARTATKGGAATSSNLALSKSYSTVSERRRQVDEKRRLRNSRIAKHEAVRTANRDHCVYMSAGVRKRIETLLRGDYTAALALGDDEEDNDESNNDGSKDTRDEESDEVRAYVLQRLGHEGFTLRQAKTAYGETVKNGSSSDLGKGDVDERMDSVYEECLQWLCIHLNEDQLPEGFNPRGRTLDVVVASTTKKKSGSGSKQNGVSGAGGESSSAVAKNVAEFASKYGVTFEEAECILKSAGGDAEKAKMVLWMALNKAANVELQLNVQPSNEEINEILEEEVEALQAIFPTEECTIKRETSLDAGGELTRIQIAFPSDDGWKMQLEVLILDNQYPRAHPTVNVSGNWRNGGIGNVKLPRGVGTAVHIELVKFMSTLSLGDPMVYELYGFVQGILPSLPDGLSTPTSSGSESLLLAHLEGRGNTIAETKSISSSIAQTGGSSAAAGDKSRKKKADKSGKRPPAQRRPREKSFFWSKTPKQTPPAIAFPKLNVSINKARKGLPAAKAREEFLSIMKKAETTGRVVLVTGETGCGKVQISPCWCCTILYLACAFIHILTHSSLDTYFFSMPFRIFSVSRRQQ